MMNVIIRPRVWKISGRSNYRIGTLDCIRVSYSTASDNRRDQDSQKRATILLKIL